MMRKIVHIDEDKCDGCGLCIPSCVEGALKIVDGKAKLVSDVYCDGLGACLGTCPRDAITVEEREADEFDEEAAMDHARKDDAASIPSQTAQEPLACGCPGTALRTLAALAADEQPGIAATPPKSHLKSWPVQLRLVPPNAPFLAGAHIIVCADCVPFALADIHERYLKNGVMLVGCQKLDDIQYYREKLEAIFKEARPSKITVLKMEVPCCSGLSMVARQAANAALATCPLEVHTIGIGGSITEDVVDDSVAEISS